MATVNPYLTFHGQCEEAFKFYESAFGVKAPMWNKFGDMPPMEGMPPLADEYKNHIMHVSLPISKETTLMGSDSLPGMGEYKNGNDFSVSINTDSREEALNLFTKLSEGGKVTMELQDTFWGAYFGMWEDKFGIQWMINYDDPAKVQEH
jgi:PhnB protein